MKRKAIDAVGESKRKQIHLSKLLQDREALAEGRG